MESSLIYSVIYIFSANNFRSWDNIEQTKRVKQGSYTSYKLITKLYLRSEPIINPSVIRFDYIYI